MAKYLIYGAGGVGCLIGGRLKLAGHDVILLARGEHGEALARRGLRLKTPTTDDLIPITVAADPGEVDLRDGDVVIMAMKTQDSFAALNRLASVAPAGITIACAQNGLEGERLAQRLFDHVCGMFVFVFAATTEPGTVGCYSHPSHGILDVGRYAGGSDERSAALAHDLGAAGFESVDRSDIMCWKRGKLLVNLTNVLQAACASGEDLASLTTAAREEAESCFRAAGLEFVPATAVLDRGMATVAPGLIGGAPFPGGSTSQGLARGAPSSEVDFLNGEISLIGRTMGLATPINAFLQRLMRDMIAGRVAPGSLSAAELQGRISTGLTG